MNAFREHRLRQPAQLPVNLYDFFHRMLTEAGVDEDVARKEAGALAGSLSTASMDAVKTRLSARRA